MPRDRRKYGRYDYQCPVWFGDRAASPIRGTLANLSRGGLAFISSLKGCSPWVGQVVLIQFSPPSPGCRAEQLIVRTARICHVRRSYDGSYTIGVSLDQSLTVEPSQMVAFKSRGLLEQKCDPSRNGVPESKHAGVAVLPDRPESNNGSQHPQQSP